MGVLYVAHWALLHAASHVCVVCCMPFVALLPLGCPRSSAAVVLPVRYLPLLVSARPSAIVLERPTLVSAMRGRRSAWKALRCMRWVCCMWPFSRVVLERDIAVRGAQGARRGVATVARDVCGGDAGAWLRPPSTANDPVCAHVRGVAADALGVAPPRLTPGRARSGSRWRSCPRSEPLRSSTARVRSSSGGCAAARATAPAATCTLRGSMYAALLGLRWALETTVRQQWLSGCGSPAGPPGQQHGERSARGAALLRLR